MNCNQISEYVKLNNNIFNIYNLKSNCDQILRIKVA